MTMGSNMSFSISIATLLGLIGFIVVNSIKFGKLELKVDTMWEFQMRRAFSEVISAGLGTMRSPLQFLPEAQERLEPIRDRLIIFWRASKFKEDDASLLLEIEREFGDELLKLVCVPCHLSHGACLLLALTVAKNENKISIKEIKREKSDIKDIERRK